MNTEYLNSTLPLDTTFPFGASESHRLTTLVVEGITHVKDLVVTGRANGLARVYVMEEAPVNNGAQVQSLELEEQPANGTTLILTRGDTVETWTFKTTAADATDIELGVDVDATNAAMITALGDSTLVTAAEGGTSNVADLTSTLTGSDGVFVVNGTSTATAILAVVETEAVDATPGQLGSCGYVSGVRYEVSSLDERNNPVWQKVTLSNL